MNGFNEDVALRKNICHERICKLFTLFIVLYPILNRYITPLPFLTLAEVILLVFWMIRLMQINRDIKLVWSVVPFTVYLFLRAILSYCGIDDYDVTDTVGSTMRVFYLYASSMFLLPEYFHKDQSLKILKIISCIVSGYAILQIIAAKFGGIILSSYLPFLTPYNDGLIDFQRQINFAVYGLQFRPTSWLNEPAALCIYILLPLVILLFKSEKTRSDKICIALYTLVCIISLSSTGIMVTVFIYAVYLIYQMRKNAFAAVFMSVLAAGLFVVFLNSSLYDYFLNRTFHGDISNGLSQSTRFNAIELTWKYSDTLKGIFLGGGVGSESGYLPGIQRIYFCLGLFGLIPFIFLLTKEFKSAKKIGRMVILLYLVLNIGTEISLGNFALYYMAFFLNLELGEKDDNQKLFRKSSVGIDNYPQESLE